MTEDPRVMSSTPMEVRLRTISAQMAPAAERKILRLMFLMIKDMPHHWDKDHPDFRSVGGRLRKRKKREVRMLTKLYQQYDHHATTCTVKRKLSALISSYIQERQKVKLEQYIDPNGPIRNYKSSLWQYKDLSFMDDSIDVPEAMVDEHLRALEEDGSAPVSCNNKQKVASHSSQANSSIEPNSATQNVVQNNVVHLKSDNITNVYLKTRKSAVYEPNKIVREEKTDTNDELEPINDAISEKNEEPEDSSSLFMKQDGVRAIEKFVNFKLNHIDKEQMVIAQKLIFEVLQKAQSGNLTDDSFIQMGLEKISHTD